MENFIFVFVLSDRDVATHGKRFVFIEPFVLVGLQ